jgi:NADH dehydrogenase/NADH:ubiquinone oxidoreductase subunit G
VFGNFFGISNINTHIDFDVDLRVNYILSDSIASLFNDSNILLFTGINLKLESPILNIRVRNNFLSNSTSIRIGYIGSNIALNYAFIHLGLSSAFLVGFYYGKSSFSFDSDRVVCVHGSSYTIDSKSIFRSLSTSIFSNNYVALYTGDLNIFELCALGSYNVRTAYTKMYRCAFLLLLGADYVHHLYDNCFSVYVGHSYESLLYLPDIVFPSCSFVEKEGLYVNCQGKVQITGHAVSACESS